MIRFAAQWYMRKRSPGRSLSASDRGSLPPVEAIGACDRRRLSIKAGSGSGSNVVAALPSADASHSSSHLNVRQSISAEAGEPVIQLCPDDVRGIVEVRHAGI